MCYIPLLDSAHIFVHTCAHALHISYTSMSYTYLTHNLHMKYSVLLMTKMQEKQIEWIPVFNPLWHNLTLYMFWLIHCKLAMYAELASSHAPILKAKHDPLQHPSYTPPTPLPYPIPHPVVHVTVFPCSPFDALW